MPLGFDLLSLALFRGQRVLRVQITARRSMAAFGLVYVFLRGEDNAKVTPVRIVPNRSWHSKLFVSHIGSLHQFVDFKVRHLIIHNIGAILD